ncbi:hypothetical protein KCW65_30000, partial [Mycobacterium tuberculosis]|nr:hypothetical protein [Mycobacterium tuberculosis]
IHVPVNFQLTGDELDYILANSGAEIVFADDDLIEAVNATPTGAAAQVRSPPSLLHPASASDIAPAAPDEFDVTDTDV